MNQASLRVLAVLQEVRTTCGQEGIPSSITPKPQSQQLGKNSVILLHQLNMCLDSTLQAFQSIASHLKLLLDAPEHIWRLLERKAFLEAAWLFLLCRLVHRALVSDEAHLQDSFGQGGNKVLVVASFISSFRVLTLPKESFPLIQRQWEIISHLSSQISHRAKHFLKEGVEFESVSSSLVALHLLDHNTPMDLLNIYLSQRSKQLRDVLADTPLNITQSNPGETPTQLATPFSHERVGERLLLLRNTIYQTLCAVGEIFGNASEESGILSRILEEIHSGRKGAVNLAPSTDGILTSLPSSTHLLLLPPSIRSYRPALDISLAQASITSERDYAIATWISQSFQAVTGEVVQLLGTFSQSVIYGGCTTLLSLNLRLR